MQFRISILRVVAVSEDNIHVVVLQALQGALKALNNVLLAQATGIGLLPRCSKEDLGRQNVFVTRPLKLLESFTHLNLALACGVHFGLCLSVVIHRGIEPFTVS